MRTGEIISSIISGVAVLFLAAIFRSLLTIRHDFKRFMSEHSWLLVTTLWNRDKVINIMDHLGMPIGNPPPSDLPARGK